MCLAQRLARRYERPLKGLAADGVGWGQGLRGELRHEGLHAAQIFFVEAKDFGGADVGRGVFEPAVVVGDDRDRGVGHLRFAGEKDFGHVGHSDDVAVVAPEKETFGARAKAGTLDADIGFAGMKAIRASAGAGRDGLAKRGAGGTRGRNVRDHTAAEKAAFARAAREVDPLRGQNEVAGAQLLAQRADGRNTDKPFAADRLQCENIRAVIDFARQQGVAAAVAGQKGDGGRVARGTGEAADHNLVARRAEGRVDAAALENFESLDRVKAGAADESQFGPLHGLEYPMRAMKAQAHLTALAVFVKNPARVPVKTRLAEEIGGVAARRFYELCLEVLREDSRLWSSIADVIVSPSSAHDLDWARRFFGREAVAQPEGDLGARLGAVDAFLRARGYETVAFAGSDAPALAPQQLFDALKRFGDAALAASRSPARAILGPAEDGGFWLLAASRALPELSKLRFSTDHAFEDTRRRLEEAAFAVETAPLSYDVDEGADLARLEAELRAAPHLSPARRALRDWMRQRPRLTVIVPMLNEERRIGGLIQQLQALRPRPEIIVVDGGSVDGGCAAAEKQMQGADRLLHCEAGRALQMNAGAAAATGNSLLFLHADTSLSQAAWDEMLRVLDDGETGGGAFSFKLEKGAVDWRERTIERGVELRRRLFGTAYGDQGFFVRREVFDEIGPFRPMPLMEDVEWFSRLKATGRCKILRQAVSTSSRRIHARGWIKSSAINLGLRLLYEAGMSPERLAKIYYGRRS